MKRLETYLTDEFHRYWPDEPVAVHVDLGNEIITMKILDDEAVCFIGSDDDYYLFSFKGSGRIVTFPLAPFATDNGWDDLTQAQQDFILDNLEEDIRDDPNTYAEEIARGYALKLDAQGIKDYLEAFADLEASENGGDKNLTSDISE